MQLQLTFFINSALIIVFGFVMWKAISPKPSRGYLSNSNSSPENPAIEEPEEDDAIHQPISMLNALVLPNVLPASSLYLNNMMKNLFSIVCAMRVLNL